MPDYRQPVQDYIAACEALLEIAELSEKEAEVVEEMYGQIADKFLDDGESWRCDPARFNPSVTIALTADTL
jgi:hypothetical protein